MNYPCPEYLQGDELREVLGIVLDGCGGKTMSPMLRDVLHEKLHLRLNMITYIYIEWNLVILGMFRH